MISLIYGLIFLIISFFLLWKTKKAITSPFRNIFWAFTAFSIMKALSIFSGMSIEYLPSDNVHFSNNMSPTTIIATVTIMSSAISNIFLFHFGISILTYRTSLRIDYKIFPALLFIAYMALYLSRTVEPRTVEIISRYSFGFNGAFLGSIGCLNLYNIMKRDSKEGRLLSGLIICGITLLLYSFTEGIITKPFLGIPIELLRILSAIALLISSFFIVDLLKEEKEKRIGFI